MTPVGKIAPVAMRSSLRWQRTTTGRRESISAGGNQPQTAVQYRLRYMLPGLFVAASGRCCHSGRDTRYRITLQLRPPRTIWTDHRRFVGDECSCLRKHIPTCFFCTFMSYVGQALRPKAWDDMLRRTGALLVTVPLGAM